MALACKCDAIRTKTLSSSRLAATSRAIRRADCMKWNCAHDWSRRKGHDSRAHACKPALIVLEGRAHVYVRTRRGNATTDAHTKQP